MLQRQSRRGNVSLVFGLSTPVLLGFMAMALEWGQVSVARNQVQSAADAAAMAAASSLTNATTARTRAQAYAATTKVNGIEVHVDNADVVIGTYSGGVFTSGGSSPNAAKVTAWADVPTPLTSLFGVDSVRVKAVAGAGPRVVAKRAPDMVLVLDVTGSMDLSELAQERVAAQTLLDCVHDRSTGESKMGIIVFTGVDTIRVPMTQVGTGYATLTSAISGVKGCGVGTMPACSGTNQAAGMGSALVMLASAGTPTDVGQAILLESDGEPNADSICTSSNYTTAGWRPRLQTLCTTAPLSTTTCTGSGSRRRCTTTQSQPTETTYAGWADSYKAEALTKDIDIYTVYYGTDSAGITWMSSHVQSGDGFALVAPTAATMASKFETICQAYTGSAAGMLF